MDSKDLPAVDPKGRPPSTPTPQAFRGPVWSLIEGSADTGARNMATDVALTETVRAGNRPVLRFYRWWPACVSLGRNQPAEGHYDAVEAERRKIDFVRRPTGGRAIYHNREISYSVIVDNRLLGGPRRTYRAVQRALLAGLRLLGADAEVMTRPGQIVKPSTLPCFRVLDEGAIIAHGRKLVGSAQLTKEGVILQHGSILLTADQSPTVDLLRVQRFDDIPEMPAALHELLPFIPSWQELVDGLASGFEATLGIHFSSRILDDREKERVDHHSRFFADPAWTWRL